MEQTSVGGPPGAQLPDKEQTLRTLVFRAGEARKALRALTSRMALGQKEVEVLLGFLQGAGENAEAFAQQWTKKERAAQELAARQTKTEGQLQTLEARLLHREHSLAVFEDELAQGRQREYAASTALATIQSSRSWRVAQALRRARARCFPPGSLRERLARLGVRSVRTWRHEGFLAVLRKGSRKVLRKMRLLPAAPAAAIAKAADDRTPEEPDPPIALAVAPAVAGETPRMYVDEFLQLDERSFFLRGWVWDEGPGGATLTALAPQGGRTPLTNLYRYARPDIFEHFGVAPLDQRDLRPAFLGYFQAAEPAGMGSAWHIECQGENGAVASFAVTSSRDLLQIRNSILANVHLQGNDRELLLAQHIAPALQRLQERLARPEVVRVEQHGAPPVAPVASVIVPLYGRIDFLEHQLAQFVHDPEVCRADLIYVLDSPALTNALATRALQLSRLYAVPFRIVYLRHNVGYSGANNAGIDLARGRLLVLLNSDVLPDRPGWLGQMASFYLNTPRIGTLGPKLVYEDETLQHAGMYFARQPGSALWENAHYYKGLHRYFAPSNLTRKVPAVSGACLMIERDRYREVGGLRNLYVQGDYEDSDLCLRLRESGYDHWYLADCELYHLESQSYPGPLRAMTYEYNSWLQTHLWGARIEQLMATFAASEQLGHGAA